MDDFLGQEEIDALLKEGLKEAEVKAAPSSSDYHHNTTLDQRKLDLILEIPVKGRVVLAKTRRSLSELLELQLGKIVETEKNISELVDFCINDKIVARGEIVVVDESFGLRIKHILTPEDRIQKLK
ncbi:FliM/FliN family flagellar motor switch protein [Candidatus Contubernalis alkaliaceticus]|uniref:FliM/FliN family flagellar motor switch protein n=1 Tax=Candidatus Contubernalis alkaliaceticus TaxID=338645 RepID=UPI001F4C4AEB|nr:FliM/FliN family flagellar motor switch protein [Candidatus Contubernalis alkalaceticus]UNC91773.1 FliM/FliN family flagellar motor switch protein [Candidatus Contubernalis alkalaceticus]